MKEEKNRFKFVFNAALIAIFVLLFASIALVNQAFLSMDYILNVMLVSMVEIALLGLSMTLIIITGGIDLSCGNIMVLTAMLGGIAAQHFGSATAVIVTIAVGLICGLVNGLMIAYIKVPEMIATLATMFLYLGIARGISKGDSIYSYSFANFMGTAHIAGIPIQIFLYILFALIFWIILQKSTYGRKLFSIGLNKNAALYSGINIKKVIISVYALSGMMASIAALTWLGRFTSIKYDAGTNLNMQVITIAVLGGTDIMGGSGDMFGTIIGSLIIGTLYSGLTVLNIAVDAQTIVQGSVLLISLIVHALLTERAKGKKIMNNISIIHDAN
jgi:ribose/xylose/arabinose/galactoside ABC-type transport system permease subunit